MKGCAYCSGPIDRKSIGDMCGQCRRIQSQGTPGPEHALTGGQWVRDGLTQRWQPDHKPTYVPPPAAPMLTGQPGVCLDCQAPIPPRPRLRCDTCAKDARRANWRRSKRRLRSSQPDTREDAA